ncbi:MAG: glycosyltransferase family 2 protein [Sphingobium sp.]
MELQHNRMFEGRHSPLAVSIVMPCLNEIQSLRHCIANASEALALIQHDYGLAGEIVIADNGSTDGSQALAIALGARVVNVAHKGYGAALIGGFDGAYGRFLIMGDCDGSYDFSDAVPMIGRLLDGADLCMGSRFKGGIAPGAMPWKNRYIGNPVLTGILNLFFRTGIDDAHCGLRAIRREAYQRLGLDSTGMEFASEMIIKASLKQMRTDQVPATLSPDLRGRAPHLRPWSDGWRHLRYLFMLSPTWAFGVPAFALMGAGILILMLATLHAFGLMAGESRFGTSWSIAATFMLTAGHFSAIMAVATHLYGVKAGFRGMRPILRKLEHALTLETALLVGGAMLLLSFASLVCVGVWWGVNDFVALPTTLPLLIGISLGVIGFQTAFGGLLIAIITGHKPSFGTLQPVGHPLEQPVRVAA